jgi:hypothetical protein
MEDDFYQLYAEAFKKWGPDLIVNDFYSPFGHRAADAIGVPLVIHAPSPIKLMHMIHGMCRPAPECTMACCGCLCVCKNSMMAMFDGAMCCYDLSYPNLRLPERSIMDRFQANRISIVPTFFGLEAPLMLPPNFHVTGPNLDPNSANMVANLKEKDIDVYNFLEGALQAKKKVVFISIGSECEY